MKIYETTRNYRKQLSTSIQTTATELIEITQLIYTTTTTSKLHQIKSG